MFTSILLYIPANLLPIMVTETLGTAYPSNIMAGGVVVWGGGPHPVGLGVFFAHITMILAIKITSATG